MADKIKWLHLSDLHFGKNLYDQSVSAKKLIEHLAQQRDRGIEPDFIFITGDVANAGKATEYEEFSKHILMPLMDVFGGDFIDRIFTIPGNHDLNRDVNDGFSKEKFLKLDSEHFHPTARGEAGRKMLAERFATFCQNVLCNGVQEFTTANGAFAVIQRVRERDVGVVGLNTAWLCDGEKDKEALTPGISISRTAIDKIKGCDVKFVLGHHPLEWINPAHVSALKSVLAENKVIYLHGHMHTENFSSHINGSGEFSSIQSGATWQAPEGSKWRNGFMWGALGEDLSTISLQPYFWNFDNQCWTLDGSRFHENYRNGEWWSFDAPQNKAKTESAPKKKVAAPISWVVKDSKMLEQFCSPLEAAEAIPYFDGATPTWQTALSESIPKREIVAKIAANYSANSDSPIVCTLLSAGCEGKTTALLQAAFEILQNDKQKKILFRTNHTREFNPIELDETLRTHNNWLIVVDEASQICNDILRFIERGFDDISVRIDFLLASRDSDWQASGSSVLTWGFRSKYKEIVLKDLSLRDAELIVTAWGKFGKEGLGEELDKLPVVDRAEKLRYFAKLEAKGKSDAFFGALLMCRHGNDLLQHADAMLRKLSTVELDCGKSLKDLLGYIAAMHSEDFDKLTFSTLAAITNMTVSKLQNEVMRQLGKEAAATSTSTTIFTRHKYIALALIEVLETNFNEDISNYFIDLALSEVARSKNENVIDLSFWRFELSEKLFSRGKTRLAIQITEELFETDPDNFNLLTKLASFYRRNGSSSAAVALFRDSSILPQHRGFYFEWGVCEGHQHNFLENTLLALHALGDDSESMSITVDQAKIFLTGLSKCFDQLHISFADPVFRSAEDASNSLLNKIYGSKQLRSSEANIGLTTFLKDVEKKRRRFYHRSEALQLLKEAFAKLPGYGLNKEIVARIKITSLSFHSLDTIVRNMEVLRS